METLNSLIDLAAMIPDSIALVFFVAAIMGVCLYLGNTPPTAALIDADADHWAAEEPAAYRDAA